MDEPEADSGYVQYDRALVSPGAVCQKPRNNYRLRMHGASRKGQIYGGDRDANSGKLQSFHYVQNSTYIEGLGPIDSDNSIQFLQS
jgi:hypothetical protein